MNRYDPLKGPDPKSWTAMDEAERLLLIERFHKKAGIRLPNRRLHAVIHGIVESQVAMGNATPAAATLRRLMTEGLDRHEAIHAIGSVLAEHMQDLLAKRVAADPNEAYYRCLNELTAEQWKDMGEEE